MTFDQWMHEVDRLCLSLYGISIHDLPDMCFRDAYNAGASPMAFMGEELGDLEQLRSTFLS